ncbi:hypothetical protein D3C76_1382830 [compost metagenome]
MSLHPGVRQPLFGLQLGAVVPPAPVPLLEPGEDVIAVGLADRQACAPGADLAVQGEQLELAGQTPCLIPARTCRTQFALGGVTAGLLVEHPGQAGAMREIQRHRFGQAEAVRGLRRAVA